MSITRADHPCSSSEDSLVLFSRRSYLPQRRFAIGGLLVVAATTYLIVSSFGTAVAAVLSPSALLIRGQGSYGATVRVQGQAVGPIKETSGGHLFQVSDGRTVLRVSYPGDLPGGFKVGAQVEAQGTFNGHLFIATDVTAKCPTKYQAAAATH